MASSSIIYEAITVDDEELIRAKRFQLSVGCILRSEDDKVNYVGETIDLSQSGFLIQLKNKNHFINEDDLLNVSLKLVNCKINATCQVRYIRKRMLGIHIVKISAQDSIRLDNILLGLTQQQAA